MRLKLFQYILLSAALHMSAIGGFQLFNALSKSENTLALKGDLALLDLNGASSQKIRSPKAKSIRKTSESINPIKTNVPNTVKNIAENSDDTNSNSLATGTLIELGNSHFNSNPELAGWLKEVLQKVRDNTIYPRFAQKNNITGKAVVVVNIDKNGNILDSKIKNTSGNTLLDESALQIFSKIKKFPESKFLNDNTSLIVPIEYILK